MNNEAFIQGDLKSFKKVSICIAGEKGNSYPDGKMSHWFKVYKITPTEAEKIIKDAFKRK